MEEGMGWDFPGLCPPILKPTKITAMKNLNVTASQNTNKGIFQYLVNLVNGKKSQMPQATTSATPENISETDKPSEEDPYQEVYNYLYLYWFI